MRVMFTNHNVCDCHVQRVNNVAVQYLVHLSVLVILTVLKVC